MKDWTIRLAQLWALAGFTAILGYAVYRLSGHFLVAWDFQFQWYHWLVLAINCLFMAYSEGYKGFQKSYSLKFANRLQQLEQASPRAKILAPLYCMNYFSATAKNMKIAYILTAAIILLILIFNQIPQPWRGILDAGVVVGLTWGIVATLLIGFSKLKE